jgi:hypothetical protein
MHDPFPLAPPPFLTKLATPIANDLSLTTLPLHIHELLLATLFYHVICTIVSPLLSTALFPKIYPSLPHRTRLNWDVHVVSLTQSLVINALALWVMWVDRERGAMGWEERVWGYDGAGGMIQGFAAGYFLWDLMICIRWLGVFGWGLLAHAVAALVVFSLGFVSQISFRMHRLSFGRLGSFGGGLAWRWDWKEQLQFITHENKWHQDEGTANTGLLPAPFCQLLWPDLHSLRTLLSLP